MVSIENRFVPNSNNGSRERNEQFRSREVFTDDVEVIGEGDSVEYLEAFPLSCAVMIAARPEQRIAGMAHFSLGLKEDGVRDLINQLQYKLQKVGLKISDCQLRLFNAGDILSAEMKISLDYYRVDLPGSENMKAEGVRIDKNTGEVSFISLMSGKN